MALLLYNTLTRNNIPLLPSDGNRFRFYCCGPTVYGPAHIGNFRTFIAQDLLRRVIELGGIPTRHVRNITDVDDKTIRDSQKNGQTLIDFTQFWTEQFHRDCNALNLLIPDVEPGAVDHIPQQISMIQTLIEKKHAYTTEDGSVYFSVQSYPEYGKLSHLDKREIKLGSSVAAIRNDEYTKDSLADFALWKAYRPEDGENFWDSPWGKGRPGWHIECSAKCLTHLGPSFDLHSGGVDLIFPHHENEIAQSVCATGGEFAKIWMHIAHLMVDGGKMSKSLGNLYTLADLNEKGYTPEEVRYVLISGHYRSPLNFTLHSLDSARLAIQKIAEFKDALILQAQQNSISWTYEDLCKHTPTEYLQEAWSALNNDLNSPGAIGCLFALINKTKITSLSQIEAEKMLKDLCHILASLGLNAQKRIIEKKVTPVEIEALAQQRWLAKQDKNWALSDTLRLQIESQGWLVKDTKQGYDLCEKI
jgi:cysteinyl-tRNA synthetase